MTEPTPLRPVNNIDFCIDELVSLLEQETDVSKQDKIGSVVLNLMSAAASVRWATELLIRGSTCPIVDADLPDSTTEA